ncbi:MAG: ABC-type Fe3+-hydroxamate transport system substrate-binding protein [Polaribacter sp.]|jgi:ABC-type Fe3+-hydroxamate transport system substrate-binding protein
MQRLFTDQLQREVQISWPPKRIVSLVPSQTELLCHLGLEKELVGLTKFCIHPPEAKTYASIIGGTKNLHLDKIAALKPDLIIGNKEENQQEQIEALMVDFPVWMSDISNLEEALEMIHSIGQITNRETAGKALSSEIENSFAILSSNQSPIKTAYLIWRKPYMVAASGTFIDNLLTKSGFSNVFQNESRYPQKSSEELMEARPEVILLSSEPYPFQDKHIAELQKICPEATILLVDGELFSWYGNRLLHSASYFAKLRKELTSS